MRRDEPIGLGELLNSLAARIRRVDLRVIDEVRERWPDIVDPGLARSCTPLMIRDGVLIVSVPSGAFAQRVIDESPSILAGLASLGERAPHRVTTRLQSP